MSSEYGNGVYGKEVLSLRLAAAAVNRSGRRERTARIGSDNSGYNDWEGILMCHHFGAMLKFYDRQVIMREIIGALIALAVIKILKSAIRWN